MRDNPYQSFRENLSFLVKIVYFNFNQSSDVPCWMFISWINQMVALLDKRESQAVHGILEDIAKHYPQVT